MFQLAHMHENDRQLVESILTGSTEAWHGFVERYAGLLYHVARSLHFDEEEARDAFVEILEQLLHSRLASYEGRASLASWLVLVARSISTDILRRRFGRRLPPRGVRNLSPRQQEVFRLYYAEGLSFRATLERLGQLGYELEREDLFADVQTIEHGVSRRSLRRAAFDRQAPAVGCSSGRLLAYLEEQQADLVEREQAQNPELQLLLREAEEQTRLILAELERLQPAERQVIALHFEQGLTAKQIAHRLGLAGQRSAYTLLDRALRQLRRLVPAQLAAERAGMSAAAVAGLSWPAAGGMGIRLAPPSPIRRKEPRGARPLGSR
jgi:DNA-directed RNA polymerase specialized sigma24 family protein